MPLNQRLQPRQANTPYVALFDYAMSGWQEDMLTQFLPLSYIYLNPFFYTTDQQGRLEVLGAFSLDVIPPEQWANRFKQITGIAADTKIIPLPGNDDDPKSLTTRLSILILIQKQEHLFAWESETDGTGQ